MSNAMIPFLSWVYAALLLFVWFIAGSLDDRAFIFRFPSSIICDLVWIPLSAVIWSFNIIRAFGFLHNNQKYTLFINHAVIAATMFTHIIAIDIMFKILFINLIIYLMIYFIDMSHNKKKARGSYVAFLPLLVIILLTIMHYKRQMIPEYTRGDSGKVFKVMTYNILANKKNNYEKNDLIIETIIKENADIVCLTELEIKRNLSYFDSKLSKYYPYNARDIKTNANNVIYSKLPVSKFQATVMPAFLKKRYLCIESYIGEKKLYVVFFHLSTVGHHSDLLVDTNQAINTKLHHFSSNEQPIDIEKYDQAISLVFLAGMLDGPVVFCGDLNDTPAGRAYNHIGNFFRDSFAEKGWGLGATFGELMIDKKFGFLPGITYLSQDIVRIDHIFCNDKISISDSRVITDAKGSDHKPLVATLRIK